MGSEFDIDKTIARLKQFKSEPYEEITFSQVLKVLEAGRVPAKPEAEDTIRISRRVAEKWLSDYEDCKNHYSMIVAIRKALGRAE